MNRGLRGYSLYELLITLSIFGIVLMAGLPSFGNIVAAHRLRVEVDALFHAIHLARKESIVRRRVVTICPTVDLQHCEPTLDWSIGWMMFVNESRGYENRRDAGEVILRRSPVRSGVRLTANRRGFSLRSTERRATNGTVVFCDAQDRVTPRALVISYTGRPRVTVQDRRGRPYRCALS